MQLGAGRVREATIKQASGVRRWLFVGLGVGFIVLGGIGVVVPGIPTTPFLIVASDFLIRPHPGLHARLLRSRTFGPLLRQWQAHRALPRRAKIVALICCSVMISLSVVFGGLPWPARLVVAAAGAYGIYFVSRIPVVPEEPPS